MRYARGALDVEYFLAFLLSPNAITSRPTVSKKAKNAIAQSSLDSVRIFLHTPGVSSMLQSQYPSPL